MDYHPKTEKLIAALDRSDDEEDRGYLARVGSALPNFPPQVVDDWFRRHGAHVLDNTSYLDHRSLKFELAQWPTASLAQVTTRCEIADWTLGFVDRNTDLFYRGCVSNYILQNGTWPIPPSILVGPERTIGADHLGSAHLLEGHRRLAFVRGMAEENHPLIHPFHDVWVVREGE